MKVHQVKLVLSVDENEMVKYKSWHGINTVPGLVKALLTELPGISVIEIVSESRELEFSDES